MKYYLAVDIGASSGRHILAHVEDGKMILEEVYRFENGASKRNGHDCWDLEHLYKSILEGMKACGDMGKAPVSMGIDTFGVDFVLLDENGEIIGDTVAYRDARTEGMDKVVEQTISWADLYSRIGIQKAVFNSIYQFEALKGEHPEQLAAAKRFLMIPEYFNYRLTGNAVNEYTNNTTTSLINARTKTWDWEVLEKLGIPAGIFGEPAMPGTLVGTLTEEAKAYVGYDCKVMLPATHDTGSAYLAVPARDDKAVYISSGTWSLLGVENTEPITNEAAMAENFTNEGGYKYRFRFLKNIMGLWMIQSIRRNLDKKYSFAELEAFAREASDFTSIVDVNDDCFMNPVNMIDAVKEYCAKSGQPVPETVGQVMQCVYISLADCYAKSIKGLEKITGKTYTSINIVGGGSKDGYLNELTAKASGLTVFAGPTEGTALGNLMVLMMDEGEYADLAEAREAIKASFEIKEIRG
ncbi:MAG: rhamnulokinase [Oscillospiraceae bacterium]|nr:rhamnulokinase [Oscillospiraceae bacterium]